MARSTNTSAAASFVAAFVLVVVVAASAVAAAGGSAPDPSPTSVASPTPVVTPVVTPVPTVAPSPAPTAEPTSDPTTEPTTLPGGFAVDLDTADASDVSVVVDDASGSIIAVQSGHAAEGMSVRWGEIVVENVDEDTLRLTWSGWVMDEIIKVAVAAADDGLALTFTQKMPYENTDAMGADRVLIIDLATAVAAEDVSARFVPGA